MPLNLDRLLVVDLESTCWDGPPPEGMESEIIQIGLCTVDVVALKRIDKRSILIRPLKSDISQYCEKLTGISPDAASKAATLKEAASILRRDYSSRECPWASWGEYDRRMMTNECKDRGVAYPFSRTHLNIRLLYDLAFGRQESLAAACGKIGHSIEGSEHRGDDDAWNEAGILCEVLKIIRASQ